MPFQKFTGKNKRLTDDWVKLVERGQVLGHEITHKAGVNNDAGTTQVHVWDLNIAYQYLTAATTHYISSTDIGDANFIAVDGFDANYDRKFELVQLNGTTPVATSTQFIRMSTITVANGSPKGDVYIASANNHTGGIPNILADTKDYIPVGKLISRRAAESVPRATKGYLENVTITCSRLDSATVILRYRPAGFVSFLEVAELHISDGNSIVLDTPLFPEIDEKSDLDFMVISSIPNNQISVSFNVLFVADGF